MRKLKGIFLDDDVFMHEVVKNLSKNSPYLEITETFSSAKKFLETIPTLQCDICLIDVVMPELDGVTVSKRINDIPFIFVTGAKNILEEALARSPIDVLTKPVTQDRFDKAARKAYDLINASRKLNGRAEFCTVEKGKIILSLGDILLVTTDEQDGRNKKFFMRCGDVYTIRKCNIEQLMESIDDLVQVNKGEAVSLGAIEKIGYDEVTLNGIIENSKPKQVTLGKSYVKALREKLELIHVR